MPTPSPSDQRLFEGIRFGNEADFECFFRRYYPRLVNYAARFVAGHETARDLVQGEEDPYYATIILKTWEPLVGISDDGHEMPVLAESWESNADKTEWIFHLKEGVRFHDGELFNAAAALENFRRYRNMGYRPSTFYGFLADRIYPGLLRAEADDENTLHLYFEKPVPMLIYRMAGWGSAMFSPRCFDSATRVWQKGRAPL